VWATVVQQNPDADRNSDSESEFSEGDERIWEQSATKLGLVGIRRHRTSRLWPAMVLAKYTTGPSATFSCLSKEIPEVERTVQYSLLKLPITRYYRQLFTLARLGKVDGTEDADKFTGISTASLFLFFVGLAKQHMVATESRNTRWPMPSHMSNHVRGAPSLHPPHSTPFLHRIPASRLLHWQEVPEYEQRASSLFTSACIQGIAFDSSWEALTIPNGRSFLDLCTTTWGNPQSSSFLPKGMSCVRVGSEVFCPGDFIWISPRSAESMTSEKRARQMEKLGNHHEIFQIKAVKLGPGITFELHDSMITVDPIRDIISRFHPSFLTRPRAIRPGARPTTLLEIVQR
jgi:hypothetical protein